MVSDVRRAKFTQYFHVTDHTGDGLIKRDDYLAGAEKVISVLEVDPNSELAVKLKAAYERYWEAIAVADGDGDGAVTMEEWINHFNELGSDPVRLEALVVERGRIILQIFDTDHDNRISPVDWELFFKTIGYPEDEYMLAFDKLDSGKNGYLSFDELITAGREFFGSDDPEAGGNWLHGDYTKYL